MQQNGSGWATTGKTSGNTRRAARARLLAALWGALPGVLASACGGADVTRFSVLQAEDSPLAPEPPSASRTVEVLSEGESLDVVCRLIGVSSVAGTAAADPAACSAVVDDCRANVEAALGDAPEIELPATDLDAVFGCPLTLAALDGCLAVALERGVEVYGSSLGCDMPALPAVDALALFAAPACLAVALQCPELIASLAGPAADDDLE